MKTLLYLLCLVTLAPVAWAGNVTLAWQAPMDASGSVTPDIDHYTLTYGEYGQASVQSVTATTTQTTLSLPDGKYFQASVTATNTSGLTSNPSNVLVFQSAGTGGAVTPGPPTNLRRGDITLTLQYTPDYRQWIDAGYVVLSAATRPTQGGYRISYVVQP